MAEIKVLLLDDEPLVVEGIRDLIELETEYSVYSAVSPQLALNMLTETQVQVILTDFLMPKMNGIDFLISAKKMVPNAACIMLTGYADKENAIKAINDVGLYHYVEKPWDNDELLMIVRNAAERSDLISELQRKYAEIQQAYVGTIYRLATVAEIFDENTFSHVLRISLLCHKLAELSGEDETFCNEIKYASMMHDVGKVGIPKGILTKNGKLTQDEFDVVKKHAEIGAHILRNPENQMLKMAREMSLCHHEKWNGQGYPNNLKGNDIPKSARIAAIADVFDALMSARPYKPPFSPEKVRSILEEERDRHFDPDLLDIFLKEFKSVLDIYYHVSSLRDDDIMNVLFTSPKGSQE
ncbi:MAG: response regulator [Deltaproteobacteria bacterium]|nr:response regulator [Deltaproteobacteria bacterium]